MHIESRGDKEKLVSWSLRMLHRLQASTNFHPFPLSSLPRKREGRKRERGSDVFGALPNCASFGNRIQKVNQRCPIQSNTCMREKLWVTEATRFKVIDARLQIESLAL